MKHCLRTKQNKIRKTRKTKKKRKGKKRRWLAVVACTLILAVERQSLVVLYEFKASLIFIACSRLARATQ